MTEKQLHKQICTYLKFQYPKVIFNTDMSGIKLTIGQATQAKQLRSCKGFPDIVIYEPVIVYNKSIQHYVTLFCGLFLEVKKESPYLKSGKLSTKKHIQHQNKIHDKLKKRGYQVKFVWSFEQAKEIIDEYLTT